MADTLNAILGSYIAHDGGSTKDKLVGAAFVVVSKDGPIYAHSAGHTTPSPTSPPFTPTTPTWLASLTKLPTTLALLHLLHHHHSTNHGTTLTLDLDTDIRPLLPELAALPILSGFDPTTTGGAPILRPNVNPITPRQLLTHTSGLGVDIADPDLTRWSRWVGRTAHVGSCTLDGWSAPLKFEPGTGWGYGVGLEWAGVLVERVVGGEKTKTLGAYMREFVLGPAGAGDGMGFRKGEVELEGEKVAEGLERGADGELREGGVKWMEEPPRESGGAGLYGSAVGYGRVMEMVLRGVAGEGEEDGVGVSREMAREMFTPQLDARQREMLEGVVWEFGSAAELPAGTPVDYGIGGMLVMGDVEGKRRKGSLMWSGMGNSRWWIDPQTGIGGVLIVNITPYPDPTVLKLFDELERAVYKELVPEWKAAK